MSRRAPKPKAPKRIWDNCLPLGYVQKAQKLRLNVELVARNGTIFINVREFYCRRDEVDNYKPSFKGCVIPIAYPDEDGSMVSCAPAVISLFSTALSLSKDFELYDEDHAVYETEKEEDNATAN